MTGIKDIIGTWRLTGHHEDFYRGSFDTGGVSGEDLTRVLDKLWDQWMEELPTDIPEFAEVTGRELTIAEDGTLTETGSIDERTMDVDGVLTPGEEPFSGNVQSAGGFLVIMADDAESVGDYCRISDGDADVADSLQLVDGTLIRAQSLVTDGMYPSRIWLRYERA